MDRITDFMMAVWDYPFFQRFMGFCLGAVTVGLIWAVCTIYRTSKRIKELENKGNWSERWEEYAAEIIERGEKDDA